MEWMRKVWSDSSMGSVGSSSSLLSLIQLDMGDDQLFKVELLGLGIVLKVL